jgi:PAS domain S-box-containing protein
MDLARPILQGRSTSAALTGIACLVAALGPRVILNQTIGNALPFVTVFAATAAAQWYGGRRAAIPVALFGLVGSVLILAPADGRTSLDEVGGVLGIAAFFFTSALIIGFGEAASAAQIAAHNRSETLPVTLHSIGDAVITTDMRGRVTSLNAVAEALTGWSQGDAAGQPLDAVFRIVNETTRQAVESPATRARREGTVVGLANHTVLIRRDGVEHPMDDSAVPIRDPLDQVSGCVLVFRDVTAQRQQERERASQLQTSRLLSAIIDSSEDAIIRKGLGGAIETWNAGAERLFGYRAADVIGKHISLVIPPRTSSASAICRACRRSSIARVSRWWDLTHSIKRNRHPSRSSSSRRTRNGFSASSYQTFLRRSGRDRRSFPELQDRRGTLDVV